MYSFLLILNGDVHYLFQKHIVQQGQVISSQSASNLSNVSDVQNSAGILPVKSLPNTENIPKRLKKWVNEMKKKYRGHVN